MSLAEFLERRRARAVEATVRCACARDRPAEELFFCEACTLLSCDLCCGVELDTFFCPADLESVPTGTAYGDRNRSQNTADCPLCFMTLATREAGEGRYAYVCEYCKWQSPFSAKTPKDLLAEIAERTSQAGGVDAFQRVLGGAIASYKAETLDVDPAQMQLDGAPLRGQIDVLKAVERIDADLAERARPRVPLPRAAVDNSAAAPPAPSWFTDGALDVSRVATLEQRLALPEVQPLEASELLPQNTRLLTKMAYRCPSCQKYVVKPTVSAKHVSFDKKRLATDFLPSVTVEPVEHLGAGACTDVALYLSNPARSPVRVTLALARSGAEAKEDDGTAGVRFAGDADEPRRRRKGDAGALAGEDDRLDGGGAWEMPPGAVDVAAFDETAVLLPDAKQEPLDGDGEAGVVFRRHNKTGVRLNVAAPSVGTARALIEVTVEAEDEALAEFKLLRYLLTLDLGPADRLA